MIDETVLTAIDARGVATVTLNRPLKHNAFDDKTIANLNQIFSELHNNKNLRALIFAANGKNFCAGADLNWMRRMADYNYEQNFQDAKALADMLYALYSLSVPTIARVQGAVLGGGVGLISCCDIVVASSHSSFSLSEVKLGMVPATISPYVIEAIGARTARRYFTTAERIDSKTAQRIGLISECVAQDQLDIHIQQIINSILANGPKAVAIAKQLVADVNLQPIDRQLIDKTSHLIATARSSHEGREGLNAFLEKRQPHWIREHYDV
jgi:methylglutaconyl-CoA hydratase